MNNTKINFNKADLICNRSPSNISLGISEKPEPHNFTSSNINFTCIPLPYNTSFRFLGVWFTFTRNRNLVKKQCLTEYQLFVNKLRRKKLTSDQLKYLHNCVLLPRVTYRLKCSVLSEQECNKIMAPFRNLYKKTCNLVFTSQQSTLF